MGLLTGMSFLSLFEIVFWLLRLPPKNEKQLSVTNKKNEKQNKEDEKQTKEDATFLLIHTLKY